MRLIDFSKFNIPSDEGLGTAPSGRLFPSFLLQKKMYAL